LTEKCPGGAVSTAFDTSQLSITKFAHKTTIVANPLVVTVIATLDMTTKCRSSAQLDRAHDATLCGAERGAMVLTIGCAVAAEYIRHFRPRAGHRSENQKRFGGTGSGSAGTGCGSIAAPQFLSTSMHN
jgi:hypothetical protein